MNRKYLNLILVSAILIIWSVIFVKIFRSDEDLVSEYAHKPIGLKEAINKTGIDHTVHKNPFLTPFNVPKKQVVKAAPVPEIQKPVRPDLHLHGIITDNKGKLAIIQFPNHAIKFLRQGEKYQGCIISQISEESVRVKFEKQVIDLEL